MSLILKSIARLVQICQFYRKNSNNLMFLLSMEKQENKVSYGRLICFGFIENEPLFCIGPHCKS